MRDEAGLAVPMLGLLGPGLAPFLGLLNVRSHVCSMNVSRLFLSLNSCAVWVELCLLFVLKLTVAPKSITPGVLNVFFRG